ncbi:unnamed protein product, partial [Amoebophrya sp. A25]
SKSDQVVGLFLGPEVRTAAHRAQVALGPKWNSYFDQQRRNSLKWLKEMDPDVWKGLLLDELIEELAKDEHKVLSSIAEILEHSIYETALAEVSAQACEDFAGELEACHQKIQAEECCNKDSRFKRLCLEALTHAREKLASCGWFTAAQDEFAQNLEDPDAMSFEDACTLAEDNLVRCLEFFGNDFKDLGILFEKL